MDTGRRKRLYQRGFTLRKQPRLVSTTATRAEMQFYRDMIEQLVAARAALGLTQEALSQKMGVSDGMVAKWESGHKMPSSFYLMCWCQSLNVGVKFA